ncbi:hypothetical protein L596_020744 [Steinernema carpocapsae]|uniref:Granulins domain-containing protein n=1 Tax=Steinernema carpocapsae TaxID=34508 RepID=A0A4V6A155_STECR|nr:hypothetical protein L596_020744 [Steinernema carpocapsae]
MKTLVALVLLFAFLATVHSVVRCPPGYTLCPRKNTCCPGINAVCCPSGRKCCPRGFRCSANEQFCFRRNLAGDDIRMPMDTSSALFEDVLMNDVAATEQPLL